jgi:hypothetical protein
MADTRSPEAAKEAECRVIAGTSIAPFARPLLRASVLAAQGRAATLGWPLFGGIFESQAH